MELLPPASAVYGGGNMMAFLPEDYVLPPKIRAFLVFKGSCEHQITEAGICYELNAFECIVPDHEPPEETVVSLYLLFPSGEIKCIANEKFKFYLDSTCFLARYLANSSSNVESLEDWDLIRGENFSLQNENFTSLDKRLAPAFRHLILPPTWHMLGEPKIRNIQRETLFHFAGRLGLMDFATVLMQKNGALECLKLKNRSDELASSVAKVHGNGKLAQMFANPNNQFKACTESKWYYPGSKITTLGFGRTYVTLKFKDEFKDQIPVTEIQLKHYSEHSKPPPVNMVYDPVEGLLEFGEYVRQAEQPPQPHQPVYFNVDEIFDKYLPLLPQEPASYLPTDHPATFHDDDNDGGFDDTPFTTSQQQSRDQTFQDDAVVASDNNEQPSDYTKMDNYKSGVDVTDEGNIPSQEVEKKKRLSISCPDLAQEDLNELELESNPTMTLPRNRNAISTGSNPSKKLDSSQIIDESYDGGDYYYDSSMSPPQKTTENQTTNDLSPTRRHSWHSSENLNESPQVKFSFPEEYPVTNEKIQHQPLPHDEEEEELISPSSTTTTTHGVIRRKKNQQGATFALVQPSSIYSSADSHHQLKVPGVGGNVRQRGKSYPSLDNTEDSLKQEELRRNTICGGVQPKLAKCESIDLRPPVPPKPPVRSLPPEIPPQQQQQACEQPHAAVLPVPVLPVDVAPEQPPPDKKLVTRRISFLKQLRSSKNKKTAKKVKVQPALPEDDVSDRNEAGSSSLLKSSKLLLQRPSSSTSDPSQRPQSMMLHRPPQYPVGNPAGSRPLQRPQSSFYSFGNNSAGDLLRQKDIGESGDETAAADDNDVDDELLMRTNEPEAWNMTVDKKVIKKMSKKEIKRQEIIYEFIQTERNYLATLVIMQRIFAREMVEEVQLDANTVNKLFPYIDQHVKFVVKFVKLLVERQHEYSNDKLVKQIGDLLVAHWSGSSADEMRKLFGAFCSNNNEMNTMYKELCKNDKKFAAFVKKAKEDPRTKRKGIPECYLLVTQRITKYPIMVQTLLENTNKKDNPEEYNDIEESLDLCRQIAKGVDEEVRDRERYLKLLDVHEKTDPRSNTLIKGQKFDRKDFLHRKRKLIFCSETLQLILKKKPPIDVFFVVFTDCIVILQENNGKYNFVTATTTAVLKLKKLILREVAGNMLNLFLLQAATSDLVEIKFKSENQRKQMTTLIRTAVGNAPEDDEDSDDDTDSDRRTQESRIKAEKWKELFLKLHEKDEQIIRISEEKINYFKDYPELLKTTDSINSSSSSSLSDQLTVYPMICSSKFEYDDMKLPFPQSAPLLSKLSEYARNLSNSINEHSNNLAGGLFSSDILTSSDATSSSVGEFPSRNHHHSDGSVSETSTTTSDATSPLKQAWMSPGESPSHNSHRSNESGLSECIKQLSLMCTSYMVHAQQQDTYVAKLFAMMELEKSRKNKSGNLLEESELKRNQVKQEEQLDQLRKEQQKLKSQQDNFERYKERQLVKIQQDEKKLSDKKAELQREKEKNEREREEIQQNKDEVQRELARVRNIALKSSTTTDQNVSASTTSLPGAVPSSFLMNKNNSNMHDTTRSTSRSRSAILHEASASAATSSATRSSSLRSNSPTGSIAPSAGNSSDYLRASKRESSAASMMQSELPIHLQYSATNQVNIGRQTQAQQQNMFTKNLSKLAKTDSGSSKSGKETKHGKLSSKLAHLGSNQQTSSASSKKLHIV